MNLWVRRIIATTKRVLTVKELTSPNLGLDVQLHMGPEKKSTPTALGRPPLSELRRRAGWPKTPEYWKC